MASTSAPTDLAGAPGRPLFRRRKLEVKSNYSYEEVKSLLIQQNNAVFAETKNATTYKYIYQPNCQRLRYRIPSSAATPERRAW